MVKILPLCFFFAGCSSFTLCPDFPKPTQNVLDEIKSLESSEVDSWMIEVFKLNQKLKLCRGEL